MENKLYKLYIYVFMLMYIASIDIGIIRLLDFSFKMEN